MSDDQNTPKPTTLDHLQEVAKQLDQRGSGLLPVQAADGFNPVAHMSAAPSVQQPTGDSSASQQTTPQESKS